MESNGSTTGKRIRAERTEEDREKRNAEILKFIAEGRAQLKRDGFVRKEESEEKKAKRVFETNKFAAMVRSGHFDDGERQRENWDEYFEECQKEWRVEKEKFRQRKLDEEIVGPDIDLEVNR